MSAVFIGVWFAVLALGFYVVLVRPQRRRMAAHRALVDGIAPGDQIITTGGIIGEVEHVEEATLTLRIADGVTISLARGAIAARVPDETPEPVENSDAHTETNA
ncbi:MAG: preprotein translocase subunit YajC [Acidimicrobiia bacterium]